MNFLRCKFSLPVNRLEKEKPLNALMNKYFPLADAPSAEELNLLGVEDKVGVRAMATGEKRNPKKGEWYLSGAIIEAYRASNELSSKYYIARLVVV
jgi:hypothetical protein